MRYMHTCTVSALLCCRGVIYGTEGVARALRTLRLGGVGGAGVGCEGLGREEPGCRLRRDWEEGLRGRWWYLGRSVGAACVCSFVFVFVCLCMCISPCLWLYVCFYRNLCFCVCVRACAFAKLKVSRVFYTSVLLWVDVHAVGVCVCVCGVWGEGCLRSSTPSCLITFSCAYTFLFPFLCVSFTPFMFFYL